VGPPSWLRLAKLRDDDFVRRPARPGSVAKRRNVEIVEGRIGGSMQALQARTFVPLSENRPGWPELLTATYASPPSHL